MHDVENWFWVALSGSFVGLGLLVLAKRPAGRDRIRPGLAITAFGLGQMANESARKLLLPGLLIDVVWVVSTVIFVGLLVDWVIRKRRTAKARSVPPV